MRFMLKSFGFEQSWSGELVNAVESCYFYGGICDFNALRVNSRLDFVEMLDFCIK